MSQRRLVLLALSLATVASVPSRAAQTADVMTPVPFSAVWTALDLDQTVPDPSCVAKCAASRDRGIAWADKTFAAKEFFSKFDSNCTEEKGQPKCAALRQACKDACAPKYENSCMNACEVPFQACCHTNKVAWEKSIYGECVAQCPMVKAPQPPTPPPPPPPPPTPPPTKPLDRKAAWELMVSSTAAMLRAMGGMQFDGMTPERFDAMRRELAFTQVLADMMAHEATYGVLAGGNGRLWAIRSDGTRVLLAFPKPTGDVWADDEARARAIKQQTGLPSYQVNNLLRVIDLARERKDLAPGTYYMCGEFDNTTASSEHGSVRGTINGSGDFI